ncbi:acyl carrier protein [Pendulispora albinea]|uniref:Acyl carrier protein n=1 Tax=Pendulispora albinea TaxID=2741071 RepID=A0ABZ2LVL4_9BACT
MTTKEFTLEDLEGILLASTGEDKNVHLAAGQIDAAFEELGYDSVTVLEMWRRIELECHIVVDFSVMAEIRTPRAVLHAVDVYLRSSRGADLCLREWH